MCRKLPPARKRAPDREQSMLNCRIPPGAKRRGEQFIEQFSGLCQDFAKRAREKINSG
jgi:hypothetical protein